MTTLALAAYGLALRWPAARYALIVLQAAMTLNVAVHVCAALVLGGYSPGVVTAVLVEAPTSWVVYRKLREEA